SSPVDRKRLITKLLKKIYLCLPQRRSFVHASDKMLIQVPHQSNGVRVVCSPATRDYSFCAGQQECALKTCDSLLAEQSPVARVACGEHDEIGTERQVPDFADLQKTIFTTAWRTSQDQGGSIGELGVPETVDGKMDDRIIRKRDGFEGGFCRVR